MSAGTIGNMENNFRKSTEKLDDIINYHNPKDLIYRYDIYEGENHSTTPLFTISKGLLEMAKIWTLSEEKKEILLKDESIAFVDDLKMFYSTLSNRVGYKIYPSVDEVNSFGYDCLYLEKNEDAIKVFYWEISLYPEDANLYDSIAEAYLKSDKVKEARKYYVKH